MPESNAPLLIVGLGNPGKTYDLTRHNIGFKVVQEIAKQLGVSFQVKKEQRAECAQTVVENKKLLLLMPTTYMNLSGESVKAVMDYYKIPVENALIVCDDVYLPFGRLRLKDRGSSGGHNGLKNIEKMLSTNQYMRLKIGVDQDLNADLAEYVLAPFTPSEQQQLNSVISDAAKVAVTWANFGYTQAIQCIQQLQQLKAQTNKTTQEEKKIKED